MADVTILGGGVIGLSIADELARAGASVRVLDRSEFGTEASWAGAGMLPPGDVNHATTPEGLLRGLSHKLWPNLVAWLQAGTGIDSGYRMSGSVRLFETVADRDAEAALWRDESIPVESLDDADVKLLEPGLCDGLGAALHLPSQAQVRNPRHLKALLASCAAQGVELLPHTLALGWERAGDRLAGVRTSNGVLRSDRYCVAGGAWSGGLLEPLGIDLSVRPVKGQIVLLDAVPLPISRMIELGHRYLVPRPDGRVLVGATQEEAGFDKRVTAGAVADLLALAVGVCPALASASIVESWTGLRPGSPDGLPYL
ncbi:MAG: FAD-dependent oxidoreductase, partial [Planctomycetota bacterium]|nr:FAD-dependent oxidoreductase [Planctomycetota bacterium]